MPTAAYINIADWCDWRNQIPLLFFLSCLGCLMQKWSIHGHARGSKHIWNEKARCPIQHSPKPIISIVDNFEIKLRWKRFVPKLIWKSELISISCRHRNVCVCVCIYICIYMGSSSILAKSSYSVLYWLISWWNVSFYSIKLSARVTMDGWDFKS